MSTAVVLGGGVSGLAAAYYLQRQTAAKFAKIILLEASDRLGGWVRSTRYDNGAVFEHGPRSLRPVGDSGINSLMLAEELGLSNQILPCLSTSAAAKNRFLFIDGQIHALPNSLKSILRTQAPFTKPMILSGLKELLTKKGDNSDETVHAFVARRFGAELADYAVDPMCRGIFAGNCRNLSVDACFPMLTNMERDHGSVIKGMLTPKKREIPSSSLVRVSELEKWVSWSLRTGLQELTDTMSTVIGQNSTTEVRTSTPCMGIELLHDGKLKVKTEGEDITADHVFSGVYSKNLGSLLPASPLKDNLMEIPAVSVVVINMEYEGLQLPYEGFGHLLPSFESGPVLGVIYDSCTFPEHNRGDMTDSTRVTVMLGGAWFDDLVKLTNLDESHLKQIAHDALKTQLGITEKPIRTYVTLQKDCIPQYILGHNKRLSSMDKYLADTKLPLSLIGSSYRGPSVNDCIYNTRLTVEKVCNS
ncbi:protoporphyrinogen oxidase-like isoform X2 [Haliotis rubra]|uniref:protoporphyrinogen oxidase-like isoform X2 n=1 Tax=Haliotis rubra TaxID=36100 RepID=UPI001EE50153|nr:protoporphyrinogen oxidase-like isoform X2 [Haliotis rubra]